MKVERRSFLKLLAGGVATLLVGAGEHDVRPREPSSLAAPDAELWTVVFLLTVPLEKSFGAAPFRALAERAAHLVEGGLELAWKYTVAAQETLAPGDRWKETIALPGRMRLERLILPSRYAERSVLHALRVDDAGQLAAASIAGVHFDALSVGGARFGASGTRIEFEIERAA